ncbi:hypothetical protein [Pengzhenrongella sicca]|uniref:Lipoprotein n=1 Tax=Pengzhenrongella sicca TaxID=2819238 RepID=A0A8A4ZHX4_9MICO|nr:hypothetical protein [Pengzhenrongella sicca]QTE30865.1 hypothetical protein J4E96_08030 [Pengzhenrongella sicca]
MNIRYLAAALPVLLTMGMLGGCSAPDRAPSSSPSNAPLATAVSPSFPALAVGDVLTAEQATGIAPGEVAFEMNDGTHVLVRTDTALPESVKVDIAAPVAAEFTGNDVPVRIVEELQNAQSRVDATGRHAIIVFRVMSMRAPVWQASRPALKAAGDHERAGYSSEAGATAAATAYIAAQDNPSIWDLIDAVP